MCVCVRACKKGTVFFTAFRLCGVPADWPNSPLKADVYNCHHCNGSACVCVCSHYKSLPSPANNRGLEPPSHSTYLRLKCLRSTRFESFRKYVLIWTGHTKDVTVLQQIWLTCFALTCALRGHVFLIIYPKDKSIRYLWSSGG